MIYNDFKGMKLSALGMGCMRFPLKSEKETDIDETAVAEMVRFALDSGINYFDTAWRYHGGCSETVIGKALSAYPRDSYYLATKFPGFDLSNMSKVEEIFEAQLKKCRVEYFDFYLFHNVCERNIDAYLDEKNGIVEYLIAQKKSGRIKHLGFSTHGSREVIRRFIDACGKELEFCQIQLNYLDWEMQNAKEKVALLEKYNMPIWVMEPVRGGRLAALPEETMQKLSRFRPGISAVEWAFRFLQGLGNVKVVLSGMSNMEQLQQNVRTFDTQMPLNNEEQKTINEIALDMVRKNSIPCTGCGYCVENCPQGLNIPELIKCFNEKTRPETGALSCVACRRCETFCPQGISIANIMAELAKKYADG